MDERSTEARIGQILLLVSAILSVLTALFLFVFPLAFAAATAVGAAEILIAFSLLFVFAVLSVAGAVVSFIAWQKAPADPHRAGILGIVATFLPPTNIFALVGGVLLLVSPEAKAQQATQRGVPEATGPHRPFE